MRRIHLIIATLMMSLACGLTPIVTTATASAAPSTFDLVNYISHYCLGISGGNAVQAPCTESADQTWHWGASYGSSTYEQLVNNNNQCLGIAGSSTTEGVDVVASACSATRLDQYWWTIYYGGGYSWFVNYNSGLVIGVLAGSTSPGAVIVQWVWQDSPNNQLWVPHPIA
jgi:hypothetical protein